MVLIVLGQPIAFAFLMVRIMIRAPLGTTHVKDVGVGITVLSAGLYVVHLLRPVLQTTS